MTDNEKRHMKFQPYKDWPKKVCPICNTTFYPQPSLSSIVCCSNNCRYILRRNKNSGIEYDGMWFLLDRHGYYVNSHKRIKLHRFIWEQHNGSIPDGYIVHHIDHDKSNNEINNLCLVEWGKHTTHHMTGRKFTGAAKHRERDRYGKFKQL